MHNLTPDSDYRSAVTCEYRGKDGPSTGSPLVKNRAVTAQAMSMGTGRALNLTERSVRRGEALLSVIC